MAGEGHALVVEQDGGPVACLFTRPSRDVAGALYLGALAVARHARRRGLARELIEAAAEIGRAEGYGALTLDTGARHRHLLRLFGKAGFAVVAQAGGIVQLQRALVWQIGTSDPARPVLSLIRNAFAQMEGRIDPPSSATRLDVVGIRAQVQDGEIWGIGDPLVACVFLTPQGDGMYVGKLAVAPAYRGQGHAARLLALAEDRARAMGLRRLDLKVRVELVENHAFFRKAGFERVGEDRHAGFDRTTTLLFSKEVTP